MSPMSLDTNDLLAVTAETRPAPSDPSPDAPTFVDNRDGNTLEAALDGLAASGERGQPLAIATGFFTPHGLVRLRDAFRASGDVRLLLGTEPPRHRDAMRPRPGERTRAFERRLLEEERTRTDFALHAARDLYPFTPEAREALRDLVDLARSGAIRARRYEGRFLHAKAFLSGTAEQGAVLAGSGNVTGGGLARNLELALGRDDAETLAAAHGWFDDLWEEAEEFDLAAWLGALVDEYTPFDVYIRILLELYGDDLAAFDEEIDGLKLTTFQRHGVAQALRIMRERGGAIVADEVGLGKTYIAGEIMRQYYDRRQRALIVCPATLRDGTWKNFLAEHSFDLSAEIVSYDQLALEKQLGGPNTYLKRPLDEYQLVVVDEAHNYRNPAAENRLKVLHRLLWGRTRDVLLLTATPVNNSIWDLYHVIRTFVRQDAGLADVGVVSLRDKFRTANALEPAKLSPDHLFSVIDATCVKRTRQFVKKHYADDRVMIDGEERTITFPRAKAISVRYDVDGPTAAMFDLVERYLDPDGDDRLLFSRYSANAYRKKKEDDDPAAAQAIGLLRSGLLKRAESSVHAFACTLDRMIREHALFLEALDRGLVVPTYVLRELAATEDDIDTLLGKGRGEAVDAFNVEPLRTDTSEDLDKLRALHEAATTITSRDDPKLSALAEALKTIRTDADREGVSDEDRRRNGKVLVFSYYADTVAYVKDWLARQCASGELSAYDGRIASVIGGGEGDVDQARAAAGFAPRSSAGGNAEDLYDILISTDVLAEGVNLQECRHVINFDLPWNPMRLVQRHGRVDRIGSPHDEIFLRTVFPAQRLDNLLNIEARILDKIALAARSIGVNAPVEEAEGGTHSFASTRREIEKLLREDPSLYERGGTVQDAQTAEEYRQTLRKALERNETYYRGLPRPIGSGMARGSQRGIVFCTRVGPAVQTVFVPCGSEWSPEGEPSTEQAACLRAIECDPDTEGGVPTDFRARIFDIWQVARDRVVREWNHRSDPANVQPRIDRLNRRIADHMRSWSVSVDVDTSHVQEAIEIVESPWEQRDKNRLSEAFGKLEANETSAREFVEFVREAGVQAYEQPPLVDPVGMDDVELVAWMAVTQPPS